MRSTSESLNTNGLDNRSQIDRKSIAKKSSKTVVSNHKLGEVTVSEVDRKTTDTQGGGELAEPAIDSKTAKETWVEAIHPKNQEWTAAVLLGAVAEGYQIRFLGESARIVPAKNVRFDC